MKTCRLSFCTEKAHHGSGLCPPHAISWMLTPGFRLTGAAHARALEEYFTRTEVRHHLKKREAQQGSGVTP